MFCGEISAVYINEDCIVGGNLNDMKFDLIIMMGMSYYSLNSIIGHPFAEGKNNALGLTNLSLSTLSFLCRIPKRNADSAIV